jgi:hypothetical protein
MTAFIFLFFGYLMDVLFYNDLDFFFDPNTDVRFPFGLFFAHCFVELETKDRSTELRRLSMRMIASLSLDKVSSHLLV